MRREEACLMVGEEYEETKTIFDGYVLVRFRNVVGEEWSMIVDNKKTPPEVIYSWTREREQEMVKYFLDVFAERKEKS